MILCCALAFAGQTLAQRWDLESNDGGFVVSGDTLQWEWGIIGHAPGSSFDGSYGWSTRLSGDYLNDTVDALEVTLPDLTGLTHPMFRFASWYDIQDGDAAWIEVDDGNGWRRVVPIYGYPDAAGFVGNPGVWSSVVVDLAQAGFPSRIRMMFSSDVSIGSAGWTIDNVEVWDGDMAPPRVLEVRHPFDTQDLVGPYPVLAQLEDNEKVTSAVISWSVDGVDREAVMVDQGDGWWKGDLSGIEPGSTVVGRVVASDGNAQTVSESFSFRVYLAAPSELKGPEGRVISEEAELSWQAPVTTHPVLGYSVYRDQTKVQDCQETTCTVPLSGGNDRFFVRAVYAEAEGDASGEVEVDGLVPTLDSLSPPVGWPGETLSLRMQTSWLLLENGTVQAELGEGIGVDQVEVIDVDSARLHLHINDNAAPGPRNLKVSSLVSSLSAAGVFTVEDSADRPRLLSVSPTFLYQGDTATLHVAYVGDLASLPTVRLGEGLVVESVQEEGEELLVEVVVGAAAPLGEHLIAADDGVRRLEGAGLTIKDKAQVIRPTCSATEGQGWWAAGLLIGLLRRRRAGL